MNLLLTHYAFTIIHFTLKLFKLSKSSQKIECFCHSDNGGLFGGANKRATSRSVRLRRNDTSALCTTV